MVAHFLRVHLQALTGPGEACSSFFSEVMAYIKQLLSLFSIFKHVKIACEPQSSWGIRALCASPVPRPSPVNQRHLRREGRKKSPILESVSFLNHSKPSVLNSFQLPAHQMHSAILGDNFRLIFLCCFQSSQGKNIDIRDVPCLYWLLWEMSEDSKHLKSPVTLQRFMCQGNENEH